MVKSKNIIFSIFDQRLYLMFQAEPQFSFTLSLYPLYCFTFLFEFININDRQNYEVVKYQFELIDKNTENLVIVIQGANSPIKDAVKDNQIQVDNTSSRDYDGLGSIERYVENGKTQVVTYVGTHTFNLTPIKIINMVNDFIVTNNFISLSIINLNQKLYIFKGGIFHSRVINYFSCDSCQMIVAFITFRGNESSAKEVIWVNGWKTWWDR